MNAESVIGQYSLHEVNFHPLTLLYSPVQEGLADEKARIAIRSCLDPKFDSDLIHIPISAMTSTQLPSIAPYLCYSCLTMLTSRSNRGMKRTPSDNVHAPLPVWVKTDTDSPALETRLVSGNGEVWMKQSLNGSEKRGSIAEFLLDNEESF